MGICFSSAKTKINFNLPIKIHAKIKIWLKESHGLYNRNPKKEDLSIYNYIFQNELFFLGKPKKSKVFLQKNIKKNKYTKDCRKFFIKINGEGRKRNFIESHFNEKNGITQEKNLWIFNDSKIKGEKILIKKKHDNPFRPSNNKNPKHKPKKKKIQHKKKTQTIKPSKNPNSSFKALKKVVNKLL